MFPSRIDYLGHLSTRQYARLVDEWVSTIGLDKREYGTHSMRRTKAALIYKATGNLRAVQILLGHTNIENTVRYLGVDRLGQIILFVLGEHSDEEDWHMRAVEQIGGSAAPLAERENIGMTYRTSRMKVVVSLNRRRRGDDFHLMEITG